MKRLVFFLIGISLGCATASAQDVITTKKGDDIQAKILEVTTTEVKYKKFSNPDGPTFVISKSDILIVRYENGEKEVFGNASKSDYKPNTTQRVEKGMRYSDYKDFYDKNMYVHQPGDPYSPSWAGVASFLIPGLGQGVTEEWGRGALFFLANIGLSVGSYVTYYGMTHYREPYKSNNTTYFYVITATKLAIDIWSIVDAVKIAKVKNMYNQDIRGQNLTQLDCSLYPFVTATPDFGNGSHTFTGLSLTLSF